MKEQIGSIEKLFADIQIIIVEMFQSQENAWEDLRKIMPAIVKVYQKLFELAEQGIDMPLEILLRQLKNLENAYSMRDMITIADTLKYEVSEGICFYIEILKCME